MFEKKIKIEDPITWEFHRSGWTYVINNLKVFHNTEGVEFASHFETNVALNKPIQKPWIGFLHNTPTHDKSMIDYENFNLSLSDIVQSTTWGQSKKHCRGLFVLSDYVKRWIKRNMFKNVEVLYHPTEFPEIKFDSELFFSKKRKNLIFIGHWMRKFDSFEKIKCSNYNKIMLLTPFHPIFSKNDFEIPIRKTKSTVTYKKFVSNYNYDILLSKNIVFLDLFDSSANNVVIECIVRNNPIVVRRLKAIEEYLGKDYPLLFSDLEEAEEKINNENLIRSAYKYLVKMDKSFLDIKTFIKNFSESSIYTNIKI